MKRAWLNLRRALPERIRIFSEGFKRHGFAVEVGITYDPRPGDVLCTWNRIAQGDTAAQRFERAGCAVLVAENATWGNAFAGDSWLTIARDRHNTAGMFNVGGPERWDSLGIDLAPWRTSGETVILAQRGIGSPPTAMPAGWPQKAYARHGGRIRPHPGLRPAKALTGDLAKAGKVVTWGSGAALHALLWGIPVVSEMPQWIAEQDNTDAGRLAMLRNLAWAQWRHSEVENGEAMEWLLASRV